MLIIFYDSKCPLCSAEMDKLKQLDVTNQISLIDLHNEQLMEQHADIIFESAMKILHGKYQGKIIFGLEVTYVAWRLVGKGKWVAPLNWPVIKPVANMTYHLFAKFRLPISRFSSKVLRLKDNSCSTGACYDKSANSNNRSQ